MMHDRVPNLTKGNYLFTFRESQEHPKTFLAEINFQPEEGPVEPLTEHEKNIISWGDKSEASQRAASILLTHSFQDRAGPNLITSAKKLLSEIHPGAESLLAFCTPQSVPTIKVAAAGFYRNIMQLDIPAFAIQSSAHATKPRNLGM